MASVITDKVMTLEVKQLCTSCCALRSMQCSHRMDYEQMAYHAWLAAQCGPDVPRVPTWRAAVLHCYWLLRRVYVLLTQLRSRRPIL